MYSTEDQVEKYLGININVALASWLATVGAAVKDYIDQTCGGGITAKRWFDATDTDSTRYYDGNDSTKLMIDDIRTITSLSVWGIALVQNTDYYAYPLNAIADGRPFEWIELVQPETLVNASSRSIFAGSGVNQFVVNKGQKAVTVVGKFGYSKTGEVPDAIQLVSMRLMSAIIKEDIGDSDVKEITSESLGEYSVSYAKIKDIANRLEVEQQLAPYIRKQAFSGVLGSIRLAS